MSKVKPIEKPAGMPVIAECHDCCWQCKHWKLAKDQNKYCEALRERGRAMRRHIYALNKLEQLKKEIAEKYPGMLPAGVR